MSVLTSHRIDNGRKDYDTAGIIVLTMIVLTSDGTDYERIDL